MAVDLKKLLVLAAAALFSFGHARCTVASTDESGDLLLTGTLLLSQGALPDGALVVRSGRIAYAGPKSSLGLDAARNATVVECAGGSVISPGFINTHEHIEFSTITPLADIGDRADHRHDWRKGLRRHTMREAEVNGSETAATAWGELRHVLSGTTSIVGGGMAPGLARNLDFVAGLEQGILSPVATWDTFPLDDAAGILRNGDCDYGAMPITREIAGKMYRYIAHVGEGVDSEAANEFRCLSNQTYDTTPSPAGGGLSADIVGPNLSLVHALGLSDADFDLVAARGASVVWSPRSNVFLYGKTLNVTRLLEVGINVALGTDWLPSGSATMGREAVCAHDVTRQSYAVDLPAKTIWEMMTVNAARAAGFGGFVGSLEPGMVADVVVFGASANAQNRAENDPFARACFAGSEDLELVMRGGKILLAGESVKALASGGACEPVSFGAAAKSICVADELGSTFSQFEASLGGVYPAILPGVPDKEPTCKPTR